MDSVKTLKATAKTDQLEDKVSPRKHGDFVGLAIDAKNLSIASTDSVFATLREKHPLYNSTIYDGGATTHIVNDRSLLIDIREAEEPDYVMIGEGSLKVEARGTRRMENVLAKTEETHALLFFLMLRMCQDSTRTSSVRKDWKRRDYGAAELITRFVWALMRTMMFFVGSPTSTILM
jgi:hypothetical protein